MFTSDELKKKLNELRSLPNETEILEFKEVSKTFDFTKLGKYFSALSNEANLKSTGSAWLVFGIRDKDKAVAQKTGQKADYTKNKAFENTYYMDLIVKFIEQHGQIERKEVDELLWDKLPNWMREEQKKSKINNLIYALSKKTKIKNIGSDSKSKWILKS